MHHLPRRLLLSTFASLAVGAAFPVWSAERIRVVATFTVLADMIGNVGGERVAVTTLVGPDGDAHVYEPTPADARALAQADLVVTNGLGFEGWIDRLVAASGYRGRVTEGISPEAASHRGNHIAGDPHAWHDLANGRIYVASIGRALAAVDPVHADDYRRRAAAYDRELAALDREIRRTLGAIPPDRRKVITSHDAFQYFGRAYGVEFRAPVGLSTDSEPSAGEIAALIRQMRAEGIRALFVENVTDQRLVRQLAREAGAVVGGTLYSDSLSGPDGPAPTYLEMFRHNVSELAKVLTG